MTSHQFEHLHAASLERLKGMIPVDCPLLVTRGVSRFHVTVLDTDTWFEGRFQVVAAYIEGFVKGWQRDDR